MGKTTGDGKRESKSTINTSKGAHKEDYSTPLKEDMGRKTRKVKTTQSVPGLVNTGNTCWLNASIQALAAVPSCYLAGENRLCAATQEAITRIRTATKNQRPLNLIGLRNAIKTDAPTYISGEQHDAADFFTTLLAKNRPEDAGFDTIVDHHLLCLSCKQVRMTTEINTIVPAEIPLKPSVAVKDCINEFSKEQVLTVQDHNVHCSRCHLHTNHTTTAKMRDLDNGIIIQLKRFKFFKSGIRKDQTAVTINRLLSPEGAAVYRLYAVVGLNDTSIRPFVSWLLLPSIYITVTLDAEWVIRRCDDSIVEKKDRGYLDSPELMRNSYILMYGKMESFEVMSLIRSLDSNHPFKECGNITPYPRDFHTLQKGKWVNDQIVNAYMWLIGNTFDNVAIMDVFFYTDLAQKRSVNKWIKADTFSKEKVLIPALQANHWSLVVVNVPDCSADVYDSGIQDNKVGETVRQFLQTSGYFEDSFRFQIVEAVPKQRNTADCGVFMCQLAAYIGRNRHFNFSQRNMQDIRFRMQLECLLGKLI